MSKAKARGGTGGASADAWSGEKKGSDRRQRTERTARALDASPRRKRCPRGLGGERPGRPSEGACSTTAEHVRGVNVRIKQTRRPKKQNATEHTSRESRGTATGARLSRQASSSPPCSSSTVFVVVVDIGKDQHVSEKLGSAAPLPLFFLSFFASPALTSLALADSNGQVR